MSDYSKQELKFANGGLCLSVPPDLIGVGKYTRLTNVRSLQDGSLTTRFGLSFLTGTGGATYVVAMTRITDSKILCVLSDGMVKIWGGSGFNPVMAYDDIQGVGQPRGSVPRFPLQILDPDTGVFSPSTTRFSLVKFTSKMSGREWAYLAAENGMWKIDETGNAWKWGIRPPLVWDEEAQDFSESETGRIKTVDIVDCPPDPEGDVDCGLDSSFALAEPYVWVYTYYNSKTDTESNPCDEMVEGMSGFNSQATAAQKALKISSFLFPTDPQVDRYRVYRKGGQLPDYVLEDEIPVFSKAADGTLYQTSYYISYKYDDQIAGNQLLPANNGVPFTSMKDPFSPMDPNFVPDPNGIFSVSDGLLLEPGISGPAAVYEMPLPIVWGPFAGSYIFGAGDWRRAGVVYWTNGGSPDTAGFMNEIQVSPSSKPIIAGFVFGGNAFCFTKDSLYALDWGGPNTAIDSFSPREIPVGIGLSAQKGLCVTSSGVAFVSKDGIYMTDCTTNTSCITKDFLRPIFLGEPASEFLPVDWSRDGEIQLEAAGQEIHFLYYDISGARMHLFYDILHGRWQRFVTAAGAVQAVYGDENQSQFRMILSTKTGLMLELSQNESSDDELNAVGTSSVSIDCRVRTASLDQQAPLTLKEYGVALLDSVGAITVTPYYNTESVAGAPVLISHLTRQTESFSLEDVYYRNIALDLSWSGPGTLYQSVIQFRMDEEPIKHWEHPFDSFGMRGWKHLRDGYFGLCSTSMVTLTLEVDATQSFTYEIPSTDGDLKACYVKFSPTKGKMYRFILDSAQPFRLYIDDTYVNVKLWQTGNSYQALKLGGEGASNLSA